MWIIMAEQDADIRERHTTEWTEYLRTGIQYDEATLKVNGFK